MNQEKNYPPNFEIIASLVRQRKLVYDDRIAGSLRLYYGIHTVLLAKSRPVAIGSKTLSTIWASHQMFTVAYQQFCYRFHRKFVHRDLVNQINAKEIIKIDELLSYLCALGIDIPEWYYSDEQINYVANY